jgi:hypothetical protein
MADAPTSAPDPGHPPSPDRTPTTRTRAPLAAALFFLIALVASTVAPELGWSLLLRLLVPVIALVGAVVLFAYSGEEFHRDRVREARGKWLAAWITTATFLGAYFGLTVWASQADGFWITFLTAACLAAAATISLRTVLIPRPDLDDTLSSLALLLGAVAILVSGVGVLFGGDQLSGALLLLYGVTMLLLGLSYLNDDKRLTGVAFLLGAVGSLSRSVSLLADGNWLGGVVLLLFGVALLLLGVWYLTGGDRSIAVAALLPGGIAFLLGAVASLTDGDRLIGVAFLLLGVSTLLVGVGELRIRFRAPGDSLRLGGVAMLVFGGGMLLVGLALLSGETFRVGFVVVLLGVAALLLGAATLLLGIVILTDRRAQNWAHRIKRYLRAPVRRGDDTST